MDQEYCNISVCIQIPAPSVVKQSGSTERVALLAVKVMGHLCVVSASIYSHALPWFLVEGWE